MLEDVFKNKNNFISVYKSKTEQQNTNQFCYEIPIFISVYNKDKIKNKPIIII